MDINTSPAAGGQIKTELSTLWIVVLINILSADIFSFMLGAAGETPISVTPWMMFAFAIVHELPIAMIILSRVLRRGVNRTLQCIKSLIRQPSLNCSPYGNRTLTPSSS